MPPSSESSTRMQQYNRIHGDVQAPAHTGPPASARHRLTPSVRRNVLLPDMFDPVMIAVAPRPARVKSLVTRLDEGRSGWPIPLTSMWILASFSRSASVG